MCAIRTFIVILVGIAHVMHAALDSMVDVADSKPSLIWLVDKKRANKNTFLINTSEKKYCEMNPLYPEVSKSFGSGFTVDLKSFYVLRKVVISFAEERNEREQFDFKIYIDQFVCTDMTIEDYNADGRNLSVVLDCKIQRGRTVTLTSKNSKICHLQSFVCANGTTGKDCEQTCSGRYGVSCSLPCNCRHNTTCNPFSGFCENGCANSEGQRHKDCYFKSAEMSTKSFYEEFSKDATRTTMSHPQRQIYNSCATFSLPESPHKNTAWITYDFISPINLLALEVDFHNSSWNQSAIFRVTVDNMTCLETVFNPSQRKYVCYNRNLYGKSVRLIIIQTHFDNDDKKLNKRLGDSNDRGGNDNDDDNMNHERMLRMCHIKLFSCHPGFFGPFCRVPCKCLTLPCHHETGNCPAGRCVSGHKGFNCGLVDVSRDDNIYVTNDRGTIEDMPPLPLQDRTSYNFPYDNAPRWTAVRSIQLPDTYKVNHITVTIATAVAHFVSGVAVYTEIEPTGYGYYDDTDAPMVGLPCLNSSEISYDEQGGQTFLMECNGPAAVVTVVAFGTSPLASDSIRDAQVWTCRDGTFGYRCSQVCNCRRADEVCDKITGHCSSGCPSTHRGDDCQHEICPEGPCKFFCESGSKSCHRKCTDGWMGEKCDSPCPNGFFGESCVHVCHHCTQYENSLICDHVTGACKTGCSGVGSLLCARSSLKKNTESAHLDQDKPVFAIFILTCVVAGVIALCFFVVLIRFVMVACSRRSARKIWRKYSIYSDSDEGVRNAQAQLKMSYMFRSMEEGWRWVTALECCDSNEASNTNYRALQKVAIWILSQDFDKLIQRRKKRLLKGENPLTMEESTYEMKLIPISPRELTTLYDEVR